MKPVIALTMLFALAGCSAATTPTSASTAASSKPVPSSPHVFSATGPSHTALAVPAGAKSADISITCAGDDTTSISITVGTQDQPRSGRCPSSLRFRTAAHGTLELAVDFGSGTGRFVAQVRFSADAFTPDPRMAAQCTAASGAFSDVSSASNGYPNGTLDLAGWRALMASAGQKLTAIDDSGAVGTQLGALIDWYGGPDPTPARPTSAAAAQAFEIVNSLCLDNGTPLVILSQYGG